jgi:O-acetyl-ADP-ribose deacetylase (regulator of RNase III)
MSALQPPWQLRQTLFSTFTFPGISTGIFCYPQREAADVAIATVSDWLGQHAVPAKVILCTFDTLATLIMREAMQAAEAG